MTSAGLLKSKDDEHLLASARAELHALTSTPLELELLDRFETLLNRLEPMGAEASELRQLRQLRQLADVLEHAGCSAKDVEDLLECHPAPLKDQAALLSLLNDQDIHTFDQLAALIETAANFRSLATDAGDLFARLHQLTLTTNQE